MVNPNERVMTNIEGKNLEKVTDEIVDNFHLSTKTLKNIMNGFLAEFERGLKGEKSDLPMLPTYITNRPTGTEKGDYLAIDLGGSNVRVCLVKLKGAGNDLEFINEKYEIPEELKSNHVNDLFDYIAEKLVLFVIKQKLPTDKQLPLGFTFSFPVLQTAIDKGSLVMWNKGFSCQGAVNQDVVKLMQDALNRKSLNIKIVAIVNDTAGTLLSSGIHYPNTLTGVILGTGTNAAYYEKAENIKKVEQNEGEMIINIEWGNFDTQKEIVPCTIFDHRLDRKTANPYTMVFEKMVSGKYLGEIARMAILYLIDSRVLFKGRSSTKLNEAYEFQTAYLSTIVLDDSKDLDQVAKIFNELGIEDIDKDERIAIKRICKSIGERAARMSSAAIAAVIYQRKDCFKDEITVGIDGSLYKYYPEFKELVEKALREIIGPAETSKVIIKLAEDGSGIGAALAAMTSSQ